MVDDVVVPRAVAPKFFVANEFDRAGPTRIIRQSSYTSQYSILVSTRQLTQVSLGPGRKVDGIHQLRIRLELANLAGKRVKALRLSAARLREGIARIF